VDNKHRATRTLIWDDDFHSPGLYLLSLEGVQKRDHVCPHFEWGWARLQTLERGAGASVLFFAGSLRAPHVVGEDPGEASERVVTLLSRSGLTAGTRISPHPGGPYFEALWAIVPMGITAALAKQLKDLIVVA